MTTKREKQIAELDKSLGIAKDVLEDVEDIELELLVNDSREISIVEEPQKPKREISTEELPKVLPLDLVEDYISVRGTLQNMLNKGEKALDGVIRVAGAEDSPRAYEVAANLIKTISEVTKSLIELQDTIRKISGQPKVDPTVVPNPGDPGGSVTMPTQTVLSMLEKLHNEKPIEPKKRETYDIGKPYSR